jgi:hypothetical protein
MVLRARCNGQIRTAERNPLICDEWLSILAGNDWSAFWDEDDIFPLLTEEEQAVILDDFEGDINIILEDVENFAPGYRQRILSGVTQKIHRSSIVKEGKLQAFKA